MIEIPYLGSGPYCYSNSLAMMMGAQAPPAGVIETLTGSPFGMQLLGGGLPFFDPFGWTPEIGVDDALAALGWTAERTSGGDAATAVARLSAELAHGPVMVGPVEMGRLRYQPGMAGPIGADHYLIALGVDDERVLLHDPQGYPYATLPLGEFAEAWRAETVDYAEPYTMRTGFTRSAPTDAAAALAAAVPRAAAWLGGETGHPAPPGTLANGDAAPALAALLESGCGEAAREHLVHFAVRVGTRRLADAAACMRGAGRPEAAAVLTAQARLTGSLQYALAVGDDRAAARALRSLAPTYAELRAELLR
ncbi:hypothetical protein [Allonocardiopsis opalescens]|uniref:Butirosin biosynthesis protein H-like n=1 Tax=Allonocardiopsis opalescens TaxID=1144618 RepID=A0A2T0PYT6_9ACTN|nr:hypothetical protein [Allonocardiopsis opalescens]PRX96694.1 hypothetical protein CLV72_107217 [Allonocardiopsis opalescens]